MKLECCNNKPVVSCKELGTPENPAVLKDPPTRTIEDVINLLSYSTGIAIPGPAVLEPTSSALNIHDEENDEEPNEGTKYTE